MHFAHFLDGETWSSYLDALETNGRWGDHIALIGLCRGLQREIRVISSLGVAADQTISPGGSKPAGDCLVLGHIAEWHYVSLRKAEKSETVALSDSSSS